MIKSIFVIGMGVSLCLVGCTEKSPTGEESKIYTYNDFVQFDSAAIVFARADLPTYADPVPEPVINWEQSLGEPFDDINGNGIYDPAIDQFTISPDPAVNQDLNNNGRYDGPDDPWEPGIPFDDIDGDGEFRHDPGERVSGYELGMPFCDYNRNGFRDTDLKSSYGVFQIGTVAWCDGSIGFPYQPRHDAVYRFASDSGLAYDVPFGFASSMGTMVSALGGLEYYCHSGCLPILNRDQLHEVIDEEITVSFCGTVTIYDRTILFEQTLEIAGEDFSDLLLVMLESSSRVFKFYFSRQYGLLAFGVGAPDMGESSMRFEYFHERITDNPQLVFPTTDLKQIFAKARRP